ncbi:MAG: hypothetical protein ACI360_08465 [Atopobiaceae bacterium]
MSVEFVCAIRDGSEEVVRALVAHGVTLGQRLVRCRDCGLYHAADHECPVHLAPMGPDEFCSWGKEMGEHES